MRDERANVNVVVSLADLRELVNEPYNSYSGVLVSIEVYGKLEKLRNAYKHLTNQRESYEHKVSDALVQLKSKKNVEANFPEALEFLDFGSANVPAVRCEDLRKILYS